MPSFLSLWISLPLIFFSFFINNGEISASEKSPQSVHDSQQEYYLELTNTHIEYTFGKNLQINTSLIINSASPHKELKPKKFILFLQPPDRKEPWQISIEAQPEISSNQWEISYSHNLEEKPIPLFSHINYWFGVILEDDQILLTKPSSFFYEDNRFSWQALKGNFIKVFWAQGNLSFAQEIYQNTLECLTIAKDYLNFIPSEQIKIYLYQDEQTLNQALNFSAIKSFADIPYHNINSILLYSANNIHQREYNSHQLARQLSQILLRNRLSDKYLDFPFWIKEGFAALINPYQKNTEQDILIKAYQRNALIPFDGLCRSFPKDTSSFNLAEAQTASFTKYLIQTQGNQIIEKLIQAHIQDNNCVLSFEKATSVPLKQMEIRWQKEILAVYQNTKKDQPYQLWFLIFIITLIIPLVNGIFIRINQTL